MVDIVSTTIPTQEDVPFTEEVDQDIPFEGEEVVTPASSAALKDMDLGHAAIIQNHLDGSGVVESFAAFDAQGDTTGLVQQKSGEKAQADIADLEESFVDNPGITPAELDQNSTLIKELMLEAQARASNPAAQVVESASSLDANPEVQAKIQSQLTMMKDLQAMVEDLSVVDFVTEIPTMFIPGKLVKDNFDATGSVFGAEEILRDTIVGFKSLSAVEQLRVWPTLKAELIDAMPKIRALPTLAAFLDPTGEDELSDFNVFWAALDVADAALMGYGIAKRIGSLTKRLNGVKLLSDLGSKEEAGKVNATAILDDTGEVAKRAGIDDVTAYNNSMPFNVGTLDEAYTEGISTETLANINAVTKSQRQKIDEIATDQSVLREELLTGQERDLAEQAFEESLRDTGFENINIKSRATDSTLFEYSLVGDGEILTDTGRMDLKLNDVKSWENTENSLLPKFFSSPTAWAQGDTKEGALQAVRLDGLSGKIAEQLRKLQRDASAPLLGKSGLGGLVPSRRAQMAAVDDVLLEGDNQSRMFNVAELKAGVNGNPFSDAQVEVYYNTRSLYDNLYLLRNVSERRKLVAQGMQEVRMSKNTEIGKVFETPQQAQGSLNLSKSAKVFNDDTSTVIPASKLNITKLYDEGYVLTRLKQPISLGKGKDSFRTVLVRKHKVGDLPEQVMHFKDGYVPRVNKNAYWFLKEESGQMVDGVMEAGVISKTHRFFDNRKEALATMEDFQKKDPNKTFRILEDREMEQQILGSSNKGSGGGLYSGARSRDPIGFGRDNQPTERFGAFEALSINVQQLQNFVSRNQWRMGMEQRWINTANSLGVKVDRFDPRLAPEGTESGAFLRDMGNQIQEWAGFPSKDELIWDEKMRAMSEWALNKGLKRTNPVVKGLHYLEHKDPLAAARAAAFHSLLGFFNPAQIWVQAQGASIAITLGSTAKNPLGGLKAVKNQFALMAGTLGDSPAYRARVAKASGLKVDELDEMVDLWRRTGLEESILTTADHAASVRSHGIAAEALRQTADKGLFFYRGGELFNRRTSFMVALQEYKATNKGKVSDEALKGILTRSNNMMLNLSKANRSGFQKGIFSIPTQFLQVQAKMIESILGLNGQFTRGERAKIMFGQLGMYGTAGVFGGDLALRWFMESTGTSQADLEELDPEIVKAVTEGFWGWMALSAFGADIDIANRGAIASGIETFTADLLFSDSTLSEKIFGAFGQVPLRFYQAYKKIQPYAMYHLETLTFPDAGTLTRAVGNLASVTSTWNNIEKGIFMREFNMLKDRNGYPVTKPGEVEFSLGTQVGQMLGFQPSVSGRIFDMDNLSKSVKEHRATVANSIVQVMWDYSREVETAKNETHEAEIIQKYSEMQAILLQSLRTPRDVQLVTEAVVNKMTAKSKRSKAIRAFLEEFNDGRVADVNSIHAGFVSRGILQTVGPDNSGEE